MASITRGILIAVEGIDGSGKSTLAKNLGTFLAQSGIETIVTKEPGGSKLGQYLRGVLQTHPVPLCQKAEYLLFAADRAQHFHDVVLPALEAGKLVISDRMADSSLVYQGYGRGLDKDMIETINAWSMSERKPDRVLYVRVAAQTAMNRILDRTSILSVYEKEQTSFHQKLIDGFEELAQKREDFMVLDGNQNPQTLTHNAFELLMTWFKKQHLLR